MKRQTIRIKLASPAKKYSEAFKKQVVREYETGVLNKDELMRRYNIGGKSSVLQWCRKYGTFDYTNNRISMGRPFKDPQNKRIKELENKLRQAELKLKAYEKVIEITNRELDADTLKKIGAKLSGNWQQNKG
jgi:transposase-like protein